MATWLLAHKIALGLVLLALISGTGAALVFGVGTGQPPSGALLVGEPSPPTTATLPVTHPPVQPTAAPATTGTAVKAYIAGAVQHPGVYTVAPDARIADLLAQAGGPTADADLERIDLAARVHDEEQIVVPRLGTPGPAVIAGPPTTPGQGQGPAAPASKATPSGPININTADATTLATLPGIGPVLAGRIVDYRTAHGPFARIEAIQDVPGIGPKLFSGIQPLITVGP